MPTTDPAAHAAAFYANASHAAAHAAATPTTAVNGLWEALQKFQAECPPIGFDNEGQIGTRTYGYATLPAILRITRPVLRECGLLVRQDVAGRSVCTTIFHIPSGECSQGSVDLTEVTDMQKLGSAITYARRYGYCTALGLAPDADDDGAATVAHSEPSTPAAPRSPVAAPATPAGWDSLEQAIQCHNDLAGRIHELLPEYRHQAVAFREANGWPLSKDKFEELATLVFTCEGLTADVGQDDA